MIAQNSFEITAFSDFERLFVANEGSEMSEGALRPQRGGVPFGVPSGGRQRPVANVATVMSGENVSQNQKTSVILKRIFVTITKKKIVTSVILYETHI